MTNAPRATLLVGLSPLYAEGIESILRGNAAFHVIGKVWSAKEVDESATPELCILDGGRGSKNIDDLDCLKVLFPETHCVLLDNAPSRSAGEIMLSFRHGAEAYLLQPTTKRLLETLELVVEGQVVIPRIAFETLPQSRPLLPQTPPAEPIQRNMLSRREVEVLRRLIDGETNKVIARRLNCCEATVKVHVKAILRKLRLPNRTVAALWGSRNLESFNGAMLLLQQPDHPIIIEE